MEFWASRRGFVYVWGQAVVGYKTGEGLWLGIGKIERRAAVSIVLFSLPYSTPRRLTRGNGVCPLACQDTQILIGFDGSLCSLRLG